MENGNLNNIRLRESGSFQGSPFIGASLPMRACQVSFYPRSILTHLPPSTAMTSFRLGKSGHCQPRGSDFGDSRRRAVVEGLQGLRLLPDSKYGGHMIRAENNRHESQSSGFRLMPYRISKYRRRPEFSFWVFTSILLIPDLFDRRSAVIILLISDRRTYMPQERWGFFPARYTLLLRDSRVRRQACDHRVISDPVCLCIQYTRTTNKIKTGFGDGG
jgi:hypothetical protein